MEMGMARGTGTGTENTETTMRESITRLTNKR